MDEIRAAGNDPLAYAERLKRNGKPIIGFFCSYAPEEMIIAAGAVPFRLFGSTGVFSQADAHLQAYCCSLVKGGLENALSGKLSFLDGTVFPHTCDSIQRLSDLWRLNTDFSFFADVVMPVKLNTESAREYMRDVLLAFKIRLEERFDLTITREKLRRAIAATNAIRKSIIKLYVLRDKDPGIIRGCDFYAIVKAAMVMDRDHLAHILPGVVETIEKGDFSWDASNAKRVFLSGGICDLPDIFSTIEQSGGVVAGDDLCTGFRYFSSLVSETPDAIEALADRYMGRPICPAKHVSPTARGDSLSRQVQNNPVDGVIFLLLKFCDPHAFDYPYLKKSMDKFNIPSMLFEMEAQLPSEGQMRTRFETFIQMLH